MLNRRMRIMALSLAMSLAIMSLATGCSVFKKEPKETETQSETQTETETKQTEQPESETQKQVDVAYTSKDKTIRITLPDSTWSVTQDVDEMRVFSSGAAAMINIVHAADANAMKNISVAESEDALKESLTKQYSDTSAFEVVEFEKQSSETLDTYEYVVKYNSTSMWAYSITYGILAKNEAYVITGTVTEDNKVLLEAVKKAVESFTVLRSSVFSAMPGTVVNKNGQESQTQSESTADAQGELKSLTDYGTTATLYARDNVNIRLQPSTEATILGSLATGDQVTVVGETSQWFKVNISGNIGYINKAFLVNTPTTQTENTQNTDNQTVSDSTKVSAELNSYVDYGTGYTYYTTTEVNMRTQPGTDSNIVNGLGSGTAVTVIGETDNWFVVSVNGTTGYISKSYVSSQSPSTGTGNGNTGGNTGGSTGGTPTSGTGVISGTIVSATPSTVTVQGDDGNTYTINYSDASVSTVEGMQSGLYITANVDYSGTSPSGELYATNITGH